MAEAYKQLTWIERLWRELKDVMEVRPIYHHQKKDNVKGHIFASFLALYLSASVRRRLDALRQKEHPEETRNSGGVEPARLPIPWEKLLEDLFQLRAIRVQLDHQRYLMPTELKGRSSPTAGPAAESLIAPFDIVVKNLRVPLSAWRTRSSKKQLSKIRSNTIALQHEGSQSPSDLFYCGTGAKLNQAASLVH